MIYVIYLLLNLESGVHIQGDQDPGSSRVVAESKKDDTQISQIECVGFTITATRLMLKIMHFSSNYGTSPQSRSNVQERKRLMCDRYTWTASTHSSACLSLQESK